MAKKPHLIALVESQEELISALKKQLQIMEAEPKLILDELKFIQYVLNEAFVNSEDEKFDSECSLVLSKLAGIITAKKMLKDG